MSEQLNKPALAELFYKEVAKVVRNKELLPVDQVAALYRLLTLLFVECTKAERIQFSTLFARMAYVCHRDEVDKRLQFYLHQFRKRALKSFRQPDAVDESIKTLGLKVLLDMLEALLQAPLPEGLRDDYPPAWPKGMKAHKVEQFIPQARVVALEDDPEAEQLLVRDEACADAVVRVQYNDADRNDNFMPTIEAIRSVFGFPLVMNLLDIEVDDKGFYHPRAFVVEPDYLMDVTAVAECFQPDGTNPWPHLLKKYLPKPPNKYLMIGNIANFFLDELMNDSDLPFREAFRQTFANNPLQYCLFENREVKEIMQSSQKHFLNLKQMVKEGFREQGIMPEDCYLEPSFYAETYGLQGRLDLLHMGADRASIVELKSGKPFMPNTYGLSSNHYTQTLLYDLMVRSAFGKSVDPANYILYSGQDDRQLRYAPRIQAQQYEALQVRNQLVAIERLLTKLGDPEAGDLLEQGNRLFGKLSPRRQNNLKGFARRDMEAFEKIYQGMSPIARRYFIAFSGLIAREHQLAKAGEQGLEQVNGLASLWLNSFEEKQAGFDIISHLTVQELNAQEEEPSITFQKTESTNPLANFRKGDIAVLYPHQEGQAVLSNQIFKCSIIHVSNEQVTVRLRSRQFNNRIFKEQPLWNLEHDLLDSSFNSMYRGLYAFADSPKVKQRLLLTQDPPREGLPEDIPVSPELTPEQQDIFRKALAAEDYFLLWGPPGTGKTSMMLKHLVGYLFEQTEENFLLLAYTNRAVDEICASIERLRPDIRHHYLRIGSRYGASPEFQGQLLQEKIKGVEDRKALKAVIDQHRIVVGTVSSVVGKPELLMLKHFNRVIIDEASQILEPMLVGLLPQFERFILIGDHKQLPAVVVQSPTVSQIDDPALHSLGLHNLRNSLFERLFKRCRENDWDWAYAQLSHQGRMHEDIMRFPNQFFYENTLKILPDSVPVAAKQKRVLSIQVEEEADRLIQRLAGSRVVFLPTPTDDRSATQKTNAYEAEQVGEVVKAYQHIYQRQGWALHENSIGVITPYRAQIAQIKSVLETQGAPLQLLTIDTVERYQGGARDVIIISLCTNSISQLAMLTSLSDEGVDRKLNVALTRARNHIVIIGNPDLLNRSDIYQALLRYCEEQTTEP
ncbi:MAG: AAA domain-containing protein [Phaeodactylibacter sp.]|uniref:ATP-dependent helicase n=1 Tax=Phaeodactylibacter sp. TaxID=1940289 RepID=UPI0032EB71A6